MSAFGLEKKIVVVTGAAQGIGEATARKFAENGSHVLLVDVKEEDLKKVTEQLQKDFPSQQIHFVVCDVSDHASVQNLGDLYDTYYYAAPSVVVNNAAIVKITPFFETSAEDFEAVLATNLKSVQWVTQLFAKKAVAQAFPQSIVNLSSITTHAGMATLSGYVASKSGIIGLTKVLAKELGKHNIRVNAVIPGFVDTPMNDHLGPESRENICKQTPLGRISKPEEIANVILFLGSDLASFCTASLIDVNGGMTL